MNYISLYNLSNFDCKQLFQVFDVLTNDSSFQMSFHRKEIKDYSPLSGIFINQSGIG